MPAAILARLVLIEARRGALPWLAAASVGAGLILGAFLGRVAITESRELQAALVAALLRVCAVFLVAAQVAASTLREINDKGLEQMLSLAVSRSSHYLGRLGGFAACGALIALAFALPLLLWVPPAPLAAWAVSLACECALVAAAALFFSMSLAQLVAAMSATLALYFLGRSMSAVQAIATGPLADESLAAALARYAVEAVAYVLPRLDSVTRSDWLLYGSPPPAELLSALGAMLVYTALLAAAGLFDFHRRLP